MPLRRMLQPWTSLWVGALILVVVVQFGAGWAIRNSVARTFDTSQSIRRARALLFATLRDQLDEETGIRGYLATRDRLFLAPYQTARHALPGRFAALNDLLV
ncbi:MAG: CHASE3 domain-containing protein, partial [Candidatus Tumulicola sp.]